MHKGFILLNSDLGSEEYIVDELKQMQVVKNAYLTFGAYDVIAEIQTENQDEFVQWCIKYQVSIRKFADQIIAPKEKKKQKAYRKRKKAKSNEVPF